MTSPTMEHVSQTVKAIQSGADDLGLTWELVTATVVGSTSPAQTMVTTDGDPNTPIPAISMIGAITAGRRVFCIETPKGGLYIVGYGGPELHGVIRGETGVTPVSFTAVASAVTAVTFARPFIVAPTVTTNINSGAGATTNWASRAFNVTTTGFSLWTFNPAGVASTWAAVNVQWAALVNP